MVIGIAMSGGVDSTACALILKKQHQLQGFFMRLQQPDFARQLTQVEQIADQLEINLSVIDLRQEFDHQVLDYFSATYQQGKTPNPCMLCNKSIKFGLFGDRIIAAGMEKVATGHYARIIRDGQRYRLQKGVDKKKDQSYFLARLNQKQLARSTFPLGAMTKDQVYDLVEKAGFPGFRGKESQDVCFLAQTGVGDFLSQRSPDAAKSGDIISSDGRHLGCHNGIINYTVGQRRGLGISAPQPLYVLRLDAEKNQVIVGEKKELQQQTMQLHDMHWLTEKPTLPENSYEVMIRYGHRGQKALITRKADNKCDITFNNPQMSITPGQFAVIYEDQDVLGSGVIQ